MLRRFFQLSTVTILLLSLCLNLWAIARAAARPSSNDEIYAKVVRVDETKQEAEVAFMVQPTETRVMCVGDPQGLSVGDYVKFKLDGAKCRFGKAELTARRVTWKF